MKSPAFWWKERPTPLASALWPFGALIGAVTARRMAGRGVRMSVPVICVGNPVAGGAGKTPTAVFIAKLLASQGERPAFLSRGYGGSEPGPVVVDPLHHTAHKVGDEPLLLARIALTIVARDRVAGARFALERADAPTILVMDDGLQSPALHKTVKLAVIDAEAGIGNGLCLPAGPLRAPLSGQLDVIDAIILVGKGAAGDRVAAQAYARAVPVILAYLKPDPEMAQSLKGQRILAFAGIGRPAKFFTTLERLGAQVVLQRSFADHHPFTPTDLESLSQEAASQDLGIVTTQKDAVRLASLAAPSEFTRRLQVLPVSLHMEDNGGALMALFQRLGVLPPKSASSD